MPDHPWTEEHAKRLDELIERAFGEPGAMLQAARAELARRQAECIGIHKLAQVAMDNQQELAQQLQAAERQLVYWWKETGRCPCGAWTVEVALDNKAIPHAPGCPTARALEGQK